MYPRAPRIKLIITHAPKAKANPIIAAQKVSFPVCNHLWLPAEVRINIPPIVSIKTEKGATIIVMAKLKIRASIKKKSWISQGQVAFCPQGTSPVAPAHWLACAEPGDKIKKNKTSAVVKNK